MKAMPAALPRPTYLRAAHPAKLEREKQEIQEALHMEKDAEEDSGNL
jgi:hypothetical protein